MEMNFSASLDLSFLEVDIMIDQSIVNSSSSNSSTSNPSTSYSHNFDDIVANGERHIETQPSTFYNYQMYNGPAEFIGNEREFSQFGNSHFLPGVIPNAPADQTIFFQDSNVTKQNFGQVETVSEAPRVLTDQEHYSFQNCGSSEIQTFDATFSQRHDGSQSNLLPGQLAQYTESIYPRMNDQHFDLSDSLTNQDLFNPVSSFHSIFGEQYNQFDGFQTGVDSFINTLPELNASDPNLSFLEDHNNLMPPNASGPLESNEEIFPSCTDSSSYTTFPNFMNLPSSSQSFASTSDSGSYSSSINTTDQLQPPTQHLSSRITISISPLILNQPNDDEIQRTGGSQTIVIEANVNDSLSSTLCPICGTVAGRHAHYGGKACTSCRAFFRRSVQNNGYKKFSCTASGECKIDSNSWRSCRWCRFQKCLASGMKPGWVLNEIERQIRHEKRTTGTGTKRRMTGSSQVVPHGLYFKLNRVSPLWNFTLDEQNQLFTILTSWKKKMTQRVLKFYTANQILFMKFLGALQNGTTVPFELYQNIEGICLQVAHQILSQETVLNKLSPEDCKGLLQHNLPVLQVFMQFSVLGNQKDLECPMADVLKRLITLQIEPDIEPEMRTLNKIMTDLNVGNSLYKKPIFYDQVFASPWAESIAIENRHKQLMNQISPWAVDNTAPKRSIDKVLVFLLAHIIILSTDTYQPKDSVITISKLRHDHLSLLHRYLKFKYKRDAKAKLSDGIIMTKLAMEARDIRLRRLPV